MTPFWVGSEDEVRLAIVPRPRGGEWLEDELLAMKRAGVDVLISLLTQQEQKELGLEQESLLCERVGLQFKSFPIPDRGTPESMSDFRSFLTGIDAEIERQRSIATHCRASIGRASLVLASLLCERKVEARSAFARISSARGTAVPDTPEQVLWVERFSEYVHAGRGEVAAVGLI